MSLRRDLLLDVVAIEVLVHARKRVMNRPANVLHVARSLIASLDDIGIDPHVASMAAIDAAIRALPAVRGPKNTYDCSWWSAVEEAVTLLAADR